MKTARIADDTHVKITLLQAVLRKSVADVIDDGIKMLYAQHYSEIKEEMHKQNLDVYPLPEEKIYPQQE